MTLVQFPDKKLFSFSTHLGSTSCDCFSRITGNGGGSYPDAISVKIYIEVESNPAYRAIAKDGYECGVRGGLIEPASEAFNYPASDGAHGYKTQGLARPEIHTPAEMHIMPMYVSVMCQHLRLETQCVQQLFCSTTQYYI